MKYSQYSLELLKNTEPPGMHPKRINYVLYCKTILKIERQFDCVCKCRSVNVKNAKFDWTRTAMSQVSYLFHFGFLGPHYFLQEISAEHRALTTFTRRFFRSLGNARLTAIKSAFGLDILLVYTLVVVVVFIFQNLSSTSIGINIFLYGQVCTI